MASGQKPFYNPSDFGEKEVEMQRIFRLQVDDARNYFLSVIKPRLDRSYKLYIAYGGDRQREIKRWQSNVQVPYIQAAVETLVPRIIDARPDFTARGRSQDDMIKAEKQQKLMDYHWEVAGMDAVTEDFVRATLIYGIGFLQVSWKKDVRKLKYLDTKDIASKQLKWEEKEKTYFDGPFCEWVDNYNLWYDWHNTERKSKQFWFKRLVLTEDAIRRRYPNADKKRLEMAFVSPGGDLTDYAAIRQLVKTTNVYSTKSQTATILTSSGSVFGTDKYNNVQDKIMKMYEVFEWWRPFDDAYAVIVGSSCVPIFKGGVMPIPFDFKEAPFIDAAYLKIPGEFEGYGLPLILESPQIMLNLIKNQRLDAATLSIHKMWVVNPLANVNKDELVTRPFGIIYSVDPNGVREIQFSDIKISAYKEEEMLKSDMQYASGVDDFSMGVGGGSNSATEVRHLRESTLERVRMFVNHLGEAYSDVFRYWMDMTRQLFSDKMRIRVLGQDGQEGFPLIEKDDMEGKYDYRASVLPSIAGQDDVKKKQDMDLFQLLISMPFIDPQKLTSRVIADWGWTLDGLVAKPEEGGQGAAPGGQPDMNAMVAALAGGGQPGGGQPGGAMPQPMPQPMGPEDGGGGPGYKGLIPRSTLREAVKHLRSSKELSYGSEPNAFNELSAPVNLLKSNVMPPTPRGVPNIGGLNRKVGGKVNTNIPLKRTTSTESNVLSRAFNIQR